MSFQTALSGLNAATSSLDAIGNNVANSGTNGFKSANAQFADVFAASLAGAGASQIGIGTMVAAVTQKFTQGNITTTNNPLDLAINGQGFFRMSNNGQVTWSRNGQFQVDKNGYLGNAQGYHLTGYIANSTGQIVPSTPADIQINTADLPPVATGTGVPNIGLQMGLNLDARLTPPTTGIAGSLTGSAPPTTLVIGAGNNSLSVTVNGTNQTVTIPSATYTSAAALATAVQVAINAAFPAGAGVLASVTGANIVVLTPQTVGSLSSVTLAGSGAANLLGGAGTAVTGSNPFSPNNPLSYSSSTSATVYDSLGNPHILGLYFVKTAITNPSSWEMYSSLDGGTSQGPTQLIFNSSGAMTSPAPNTIGQSYQLTNGAANLVFTLDLTGSTQFGNLFGVNRIAQDGYTSGRLSGLSVATDGTVQGRYTNGQTRNLAQVVLAKFNNPNGLLSIGGNQWQETSASGQPLVGVPGSGALGALQSASVEESNVDLTAELVNMITAQRAYQANAQTIKTQDQIMQTLVNLR
jgi:flagellar hook protein FlgE